MKKSIMLQFVVGSPICSPICTGLYASRSLNLSQRRYCTTRREMLVAVVMCTHFRISRSPRRRWVTPWTRICCQSCPWVAATLLEELTADLPPAGSNLDLIVASRQDATLTTVREWVQLGAAPTWPDCSGLSPELRCWRLQFGNLSVDTEGRLWHRRAPL